MEEEIKGFQRTINTDDEMEIDSSSEEELANKKKNKKKKKKPFSATFSFSEIVPKNVFDLDNEPVKLFKENEDLNKDSESEEESSSSEEEETTNFKEDKFKKFKVIKENKNLQKNKEKKKKEEEEFDKSYFNQNVKIPKLSGQNGEKRKTFKEMNLSKQIQKVLENEEFDHPTPIQEQSIPVLLQGLDLSGSAYTGSGKTLAFLIPIIERLLHRNKKQSAIRTLILLPTRELAQQCFNVCLKFTKYTTIKSALVIGGKQYDKQVRALKQKPEIVIATPGRLITHLLNTANFSLEYIEILVLDEADRLLELGFKKELEKIISECPKNRQSMLFSATMTDNIKELSRLSLSFPVRICCNPKTDTPQTLVQEFVKIRGVAGGESKEVLFREAVLCSLCFRIFKRRVIIFVNRKIDARRLKIMFFLFGKKVSELHGDLSFDERMIELERFKKRKTKFLITTDVAARGLDIPDVNTVVNFFMPYDLNTYIHRVGRTARIGKDGISVSLIDESSRNLLRQVVKRARRNNEIIRHRVVDSEAIKYYQTKIKTMNPKITELFKKGQMDNELKEADKLLEDTTGLFDASNEDIINRNKSSTKLKWFQTKEEADLDNKRERDLKHISKSGLKRNRDILSNKLQSNKKKRRRISSDPKLMDEEEKQKVKESYQAAKAKKRKKKGGIKNYDNRT